MLGPERSARQVIQRLASTWRWWGEENDYFSSADDAQAIAAETIATAAPQAQIEYCDVRHRDDLSPVSEVIAGQVVVLLAVRIGTTRLIDNMQI